jgi:hypothetical protein
MGSAYAADHREALYCFSYQGRSVNIPSGLDADLVFDFTVAFNDNAAHIVEARQLFRDVGDDPLLQIDPTGWVPDVFHGNLALAKHAGIALPSKAFICPSDATLLRWLPRDAFETELPNLSPLGSPNFARRVRMRPSYSRSAAAWQRDVGPNVITPISQASFNGSANPDLQLGERKEGDVSFPSQKVWLFDQQDRHSNRVQMFYAEAEAAQPLLMFDGSVGVRKYADANRSAVPRSWQVFLPGVGAPRLRIDYEPIAALGEAPELRSTAGSGGGRDVKFWYTAGGLRGIDFGGPNVDTRNWSP